MALAIGLRFYLSSLANRPNLLQRQGIAAARMGIDLSQEGRKLLPQEEQKELDSIYAEALQSLRPDERERFFSLARKGAAAEEQELNESWMLMQKALGTLPQGRRDRLFALIDKAVQLAQQKKVVSEKKPEG
jgi:hypothetical protein